METYYEYLAHHGILGMRWGKKNGPPYPLNEEDHSASEKKAGYKKSLKGVRKKLYDHYSSMSERDNEYVEQTRKKKEEFINKYSGTKDKETALLKKVYRHEITDKELKEEFKKEKEELNKYIGKGNNFSDEEAIDYLGDFTKYRMARNTKELYEKIFNDKIDEFNVDINAATKSGEEYLAKANEYMNMPFYKVSRLDKKLSKSLNH